jgi:hypothetical protein
LDVNNKFSKFEPESPKISSFQARKSSEMPINKGKVNVFDTEMRGGNSEMIGRHSEMPGKHTEMVGSE